MDGALSDLLGEASAIRGRPGICIISDDQAGFGGWPCRTPIGALYGYATCDPSGYNFKPLRIVWERYPASRGACHTLDKALLKSIYKVQRVYFSWKDVAQVLYENAYDIQACVKQQQRDAFAAIQAAQERLESLQSNKMLALMNESNELIRLIHDTEYNLEDEQ